MVAIIDYGVGNLYSLQSSLAAVGVDAEITADTSRVRNASHVILPGVGAFADAMEKLQQAEMDRQVLQAAQDGKPLLGICLGMQLLFSCSYEFGQTKGLGLLEGEILPLKEALAKQGKAGYKVPHIGWNPLQYTNKTCPLLCGVQEGSCFYYVHSFYAPVTGQTAAYSEYGVDVSGVVQRGKVFGTQFHPEKSGAAGLALLKAFAEVG